MRSYLRSLVLLACMIVATLATPVNHGANRHRRAQSPARTMMFSGYFHGRHPQHRGFSGYSPRNYEPEGAMTAFAAGNTVSAGSYYGNGGGVQPAPEECSQCNGDSPALEDPTGSPPEVIPTTDEREDAYPEEGVPGADEAPATEPPAVEQDAPEEDEEEPAAEPAPAPAPTPAASPSPAPPSRKPASKPKQKPRSDDNDSDEDDEDQEPNFFPGKRPRGRGSFYNSYFPMIFGSFPGSYGGGRNGGGNGGSGTGEGTYNPGVATAIANSFSTGRGAVATSHATAYGGPHFLSNGSRKGSTRRTSPSA